MPQSNRAIPARETRTLADARGPCASAARSAAIAVLLGATFLASPLTAARADGAAVAPVEPAQAAFHQAAAEAVNTRGRTVERWITSLHAALAITPAEESKWNDVAQTMRENPSAVQNLAAGRFDQVPQGMISSFETLYDSMPDPQKKVALQLLQGFGRAGALPYCQCFGSNRRQGAIAFGEDRGGRFAVRTNGSGLASRSAGRS
jgi:protein CpxP